MPKHSKSSKTDKELMWERLKYVPQSKSNWLGLAGFKRGEIALIAAGRSMGKSAITMQVFGRALRKTDEVVHRVE